MLSRQEIFDKAVPPLLKQGVRSYDVIADGCAYRGSGGNKCVVGQIISDEIYDSRIEMKAVSQVHVLMKNSGTTPPHRHWSEPDLEGIVLLRDILEKEGIDVNDDSTMEFLVAL